MTEREYTRVANLTRVYAARSIIEGIRPDEFVGAKDHAEVMRILRAWADKLFCRDQVDADDDELASPG